MEKNKDFDLRLLEKANEYFVNSLKDNDNIIKYLTDDRGLSHEMIKELKLGYLCSVGAFMNYMKDNGYDKESLINAGLLSSYGSRVYSIFKDRVTFPIRDEKNRVIAFGARTLTPNRPKYVNSPETEHFKKRTNLYGIESLRRAKEAIIVEGYMDVISLHNAGFVSAIAPLGTALTNEQIDLINLYTDKIYLCFDNDSAGKMATERAIEMFKESGIDTFVINVEPFKDPDEFIKGMGKDAFSKRIEKATPSREWLDKNIELNSHCPSISDVEVSR